MDSLTRPKRWTLLSALERLRTHASEMEYRLDDSTGLRNPVDLIISTFALHHATVNEFLNSPRVT